MNFSNQLFKFGKGLKLAPATIKGIIMQEWNVKLKDGTEVTLSSGQELSIVGELDLVKLVSVHVPTDRVWCIKSDNSREQYYVDDIERVHSKEEADVQEISDPDEADSQEVENRLDKFRQKIDFEEEVTSTKGGEEKILVVSEKDVMSFEDYEMRRALKPDVIKANKEIVSKNGELKPDFTLIPQLALKDVAMGFTLGEKKYSDFNYSKGLSLRTYLAGALRHINAKLAGEDLNNEDDTSLDHMVHAVCCLMMAIDNVKNDTAIDDRNPHYESKDMGNR